jgi:hypothetical protein
VSWPTNVVSLTDQVAHLRKELNETRALAVVELLAQERLIKALQKVRDTSGMSSQLDEDEVNAAELELANVKRMTA